MGLRERLARHLSLLSTDPLKSMSRAVGLARARYLFRGRELGPSVSANGRVQAHGPGVISIGFGTTFAGGMVPTELVSHRGARVQIGAQCIVNYGVSIEAHISVTIGDRCMLGSFVRVADHAGGRSGAILIGNDVWLAHGVIVEPGVTIGAGSVVSAASVVAQDVPPASLVSGNPAQCVPLITNGSKPRSIEVPS